MSINTCECGDYEFFCVYGTVTTQVYPLNFLETSLIDELEGDNIFYRRKFNGELKFGGRGLLADWNYFHDILTASSCNRIDFLIFKDGVPYWEGYISTVHGTWDFDECTFTTTPVIEDDYTPFIEAGDAKIEIVRVPC